tara:strand:+ start:1130 stop:1666 length:537 start_codon:yes stop_codon:yes gene_type:complete
MPSYIPENYNLATGTKWYMIFPFQKIDSTITSENIALNLFNFSLPEVSMGETEFGIRGVQIPVPNGVRDESKLITFNYILSANWYQYKLLYKWFSQIANECGGQTAPEMMDYMLDVTVMIISEYKNPLFEIVFHNAWIKNMAAVDFNYQDDDEVIHHSFDINFSHYTIKNLIEEPCYC